MITQLGSQIVLTFASEEEAKSVLEILSRVIASPEPPCLPEPLTSPLPSTLLTEERQAALFLQRESQKQSAQNAEAVRQKLTEGILPFRTLQTPPNVPILNSPRKTTRQFAGETMDE